jgi:uncharacterized protein involved in outer membrane biogenesis
MKVLKRIILAGIILVIALSLVAYFAIKIAFPPQKIKDLVHKHGSEALNRDVSVEDVSIRVFPNLKLSVREVNVANAPGFSSDPCVKLRELALSINFLSLIRFSPVINEIKLVDPEILYEVSKDGHNNLEGIGKPDTAKVKPKDTTKTINLPAGVALRSFLIENGRVRYRDMQSGREITLDQINQTVSVDLDEKLEDASTKGKLDISEITVKDSAFGLRKGNIHVSVRHDIRLNLPAERLQVKALELGFQDIRATIKGEASHFITKPPVIDFTLDAPDIRLASVLKEVPAGLSPEIPKLSAKGVAALAAHVNGEIDSGKTPDVTAHFTVQDGGVSHKDLAAAVENLNVELDLAGDSLRLGRLAFDAGGNPVSMDALVTSLRKTGSSPSQAPMLRDFNLSALVDLGKIVPLLQKMAMLDKDMKVTGMIRAKAKASGMLDPQAPQNLKAQGDVELKDVFAQVKQVPQPIRLNGQVKVDNDKITEDLKVLLNESDVSVQSTITNYLAMVMPKAAKGLRTKAKVNVKSAMLNLDQLLPGGEKKKDEKSEPMTKWPSLPKLDADIDVQLAKTQFMNLAMTNFTSHSTLAACVLITNLKGSLYTGGFSSTMRADLCDTSNADIALKLNVARVEANDFISRLNDRLPAAGNRLFKSLANADSAIYGKFSLNMDVRTHGLPQTVTDNLTGAIDFDIADGKLMETGLVKGLSDALGKVNKNLAFHEMSFSNFAAKLEAGGGKLLVKNADINESVVGALLAAGGIGFDNSLSLQLEDHLPAGLSQAVAGPGSSLTSELSKYASVPGLGKVNLVPTDKNGRAILYFLVGGALTHPTFSLDLKRMATEGAGGAKAAVEDAARKKVNEAKAAAQAKADSAAAALRARADEEKKKAQKKAEEGAKQQGKKILKGLGL